MLLCAIVIFRLLLTCSVWCLPCVVLPRMVADTGLAGLYPLHPVFGLPSTRWPVFVCSLLRYVTWCWGTGMLGTAVVRVMCLVNSGGCCILARSRVAEFVRCRVCHANHRPGRSHRLACTWVASAIFTGLHAVSALSLMPYCGTWGHSRFSCRGHKWALAIISCAVLVHLASCGFLWHSIEWCAIAHRLLLSHLVSFLLWSRGCVRLVGSHVCCTRLSFAPVEHAVVRSRLLCLPSVIDAMLVRLSNLPVYVVLTGPCWTAAG